MTTRRRKITLTLLTSLVIAILALQACLPTTEAEASTEAVNRQQAATTEPTPTAYAQYLANAGVLVVNGDTKIAFDPIFRMGFGTYLLLPEELERALFAGEAPFDGLDAVFISHYHGDHFSARDVFRLLTAQPELEVFAPQQAVEALRAVDRTTGIQANPIFQRVHAIALEYEQAPVEIKRDDLLVEAVRIPHSGWPNRMQDVENIAFRVSLLGDNQSTVTAAHLGDADTRDAHYDHDADYWAKRPLHVALPPYWYLQSEDGRGILTNRLRPELTLGVHVPKEFSESDRRAVQSEGVDVLTEPLDRRALTP